MVHGHPSALEPNAGLVHEHFRGQKIRFRVQITGFGVGSKVTACWGLGLRGRELGCTITAWWGLGLRGWGVRLPFALELNGCLRGERVLQFLFWGSGFRVWG